MNVMITCDGCGLTAETSTQYDAGCNEIDGVLSEGWVHTSTEDFCPDCADNAESPDLLVCSRWSNCINCSIRRNDAA